MTIIAMCIGIAILILWGFVFALPALIPSIRRRARSSHLRRIALAVLLSINSIAFFFIAFTYLGAILTKTFAYVPLCGDFECVGTSNPYVNDPHRDNLLTREIWLRHLLVPADESKCYTGDADVCQVATELLAYQSTTDYENSFGENMIALFTLFSPGFSSTFFVCYFTRDNRKQKQKHKDDVVVMKLC